MTLVAAGQKSSGRSQLESALKLKLADNDAQQAHEALAQLN